MFLSVNSVLEWVEKNIVWGIPLIALILVVGIILTIKLRCLQITHLGEALKAMVVNDEAGKGEVSSFGALCISMAATLGTGKIIGVATAIAIGGPGALFWMILAAIFGMATKYAEGYLAIRFRKIEPDGTVMGGPFTYIEEGLGKKWRWLSKLFAIFGALAGVMGIGTMTQMNSITESAVSVFDPTKANSINVFGNDISIYAIIVGIVVTIISAIAVIGGIDRISKVSVILVPFMAVGYFLACLSVIVFNIGAVPSAFVKIFKSAFDIKAGLGGLAGMGMMTAMREGVSKGIFSNEAGLGSAPIAIASAQSNNPIKEGLACMSSTFIDTMVLCLTIGLGVVITGAYETNDGINITISTFATGLNISNLASAIIVLLAIGTFAFTTIIGWNVYGEKCVAYLTNGNKKWVMFYKVLYIIAVGIAPFLTLSLIWTTASIFNGLMALPNLVGLLGLSGIVAKETNEYFKKRKLEKMQQKDMQHN